MMLEKTEIRPSKIHGLGVFAAKEITGGEAIHKIDDSRVVDDQHRRASRKLRKLPTSPTSCNRGIPHEAARPRAAF